MVWVWVLLGILLVVLAGVVFYSRFRGMCRTVRAELVKFVQIHYPETEVLREEQGNLVLRTGGGEERVWELADVYAAVARLPRMGQDPGQRARIYRQAAALVFAPDPDDRPLTLAAHGAWIRPQLVRAETVDLPEAAVIQSPVPDLGLVTTYVLALPADTRCLTGQDLAELGLDQQELHRLALENLRQDFPEEVVRNALSGEASAVQFHDGFDAARLLLVPGMLKAGQELVALVPHQDLLALLPAEAAEEPEKLREGLRQVECCDHVPLLERPVRVTHAGFRAL